jgi:K+-sensing histidine kinase KdpD
MRKILKNFDKKNIPIYLNNNSTFSYYINPTFEVLLFLLLENAIKYTPIGKPINISFYEPKNTLSVEIKSIGPFCKPDELNKLCTKGFRGDNARSSGKNGNGLGLCFAAQICNLLKIQISFKSLYNYEKIDDIPYGDFIINLVFVKRS